MQAAPLAAVMNVVESVRLHVHMCGGCTHAHIHAHTYMHTHTYTQTHTYTYIHTCRQTDRQTTAPNSRCTVCLLPHPRVARRRGLMYMLFVCMYVLFVCMYVGMVGHMGHQLFVCMFVCMVGHMGHQLFVCMDVCRSYCCRTPHVCMYIYMYVCMWSYCCRTPHSRRRTMWSYCCRTSYCCALPYMITQCLECAYAVKTELCVCMQ